MCFIFFFFKQKTAYEVRISDWSSDVCSSDLYREFEALMAFAVENKDTEAGSKQADDIVGAVDIRETVASPETALKRFRDMKPGLTPQKLLASTRRMFEGEAMRALLTLPAEQQEAETRLAMALKSPVEPAKDVRLTEIGRAHV